MKKIINIILLVFSLFTISSCETIAQVEYEGTEYSYNYFLNGVPVVIINGNYYYHRFVGGRLMYCIIPEYYIRYITYYPQSRRYFHVRPRTIPHAYRHRNDHFNQGRIGRGPNFSNSHKPSIHQRSNHHPNHNGHRGGR